MRTALMIFTMLGVLLTFALASRPPERQMFGDRRNVESYRVEVSFDKTLHILFPAAIEYVDLGSNSIIAGKADGARNALRLKAAVRDFKGETNFSVITSDGSFYSFIVTYAANPEKISIEMEDWLRKDPFSPFAERQMYVALDELGDVSPLTVSKIMYNIYKKDECDIKHIGCRKFGIQTLLKGIYIHDGLFFLHLSLRNPSAVGFDIDQIRFKIVDKKVVKRTAVQETYIKPVRVYNDEVSAEAKKTVRNVFAFRKFTIPDGKVLSVEIFEKNGGRHQAFSIENFDLVEARTVDDLKIQ